MADGDDVDLDGAELDAHEWELQQQQLTLMMNAMYQAQASEKEMAVDEEATEELPGSAVPMSKHEQQQQQHSTWRTSEMNQSTKPSDLDAALAPAPSVPLNANGGDVIVTPAFQPVLDKMAPEVRKLLVDHVDPASISIDALLRAIKRYTPASRRAASEGDVMCVPGALTPEACAALRAAVDRDQSLLIDTVDGGPEHQLTLSREELEQLIGADACLRLWRLPCQYHRWRRAVNASGEEAGLDSVTDADACKEAKTLQEAFVRRYSVDTRPFIPFHPDAYELTVNIALSADAAHGGGRLIGLFNGAIQAVVRAEGEATVHSSQLLHAVSKMTSGVRYSLILFFDRAPRKNGYRWTEQTWGAKSRGSGVYNARWWEE